MVAKYIRFLFLCVATMPWLWWRFWAFFTDKDATFQGSSQFCALFPGKFGTLFRAAFYKLSLENTSERTSIAFLTTFSNPDARIDQHVSIGTQCNIGLVHIEKNCILSSQFCITSGRSQHNFEDLETPIRLQDGKFELVTLGANSWIGAGAIIMADIGEGSIIATGSIVTEPIPPFSIAAGIPAKVVETRKGTKSIIKNEVE